MPVITTPSWCGLTQTLEWRSKCNPWMCLMLIAVHAGGTWNRLEYETHPLGCLVLAIFAKQELWSKHRNEPLLIYVGWCDHYRHFRRQPAGHLDSILLCIKGLYTNTGHHLLRLQSNVLLTKGCERDTVPNVCIWKHTHTQKKMVVVWHKICCERHLLTIGVTTSRSTLLFGNWIWKISATFGPGFGCVVMFSLRLFLPMSHSLGFCVHLRSSTWSLVSLVQKMSKKASFGPKKQ